MYLGVNGEKIKATGRTRTAAGVKLYEYSGDYIYLTNYKKWFYIDEADNLQRFFQPVTVTANKTKKILLAGFLLLIAIQK